jgi:hypothetical protein
MLVIAGTAFAPYDPGALRVSLSNLRSSSIADFTERLACPGRGLARRSIDD